MIVFMLMFICMYVCMSLSDRVIRNHSCGGMITYAGEWHEEIPGSRGIKWEEYPDRSPRSVSCGYELILCDYTMFMLWTCYAEGYINGMKEVCFVTCWDKHG